MWHQVESRNDAVVRALASHQCVPCSIPGPGVLCGLNLLLVLFLAPRVFFSLGTPVFPASQKPTFPNSNMIWIIVKHFNMILWLGWSHKYSLWLTLKCTFYIFASSHRWIKWAEQATLQLHCTAPTNRYLVVKNANTAWNLGKKLLRCQKFSPLSTDPPMKNIESNCVWRKAKHKYM